MFFLTFHPCIASSFHSQFAEKFVEFKEAARLAKEKSQEKIELTSSPSQVGTLSLPSRQVIPTLKQTGTGGVNVYLETALLQFTALNCCDLSTIEAKLTNAVTYF